MKNFTILIFAALMLASCLLDLKAQTSDEKTREDVIFAKGANSVVIKGTIKDALGKEFVVRASKGRTLSVLFESESPAYFYLRPETRGRGSGGYANFQGKEKQRIRKSGKYIIGINMFDSVSTSRSNSNDSQTETFELKITLK